MITIGRNGARWISEICGTKTFCDQDKNKILCKCFYNNCWMDRHEILTFKVPKEPEARLWWAPTLKNTCQTNSILGQTRPPFHDVDGKTNIHTNLSIHLSSTEGPLHNSRTPRQERTGTREHPQLRNCVDLQTLWSTARGSRWWLTH